MIKDIILYLSFVVVFSFIFNIYDLKWGKGKN